MLERIKDMFVYEYTFLDDLSFIKPIENFFSPEMEQKYLYELKVLFESHGWEGDGELGVIWLPPFIGVGAEDTHGHYIFHVKQENNGISYLASDIQLPFARLIEQNNFSSTLPRADRGFSSSKNYEEINIVQTDVDALKEKLTLYKKNIEVELGAISQITDSIIVNDLTEKILGYNQCMIVQYVTEFFDDCYLRILVEVLSDGNQSNLKLIRSSVKIDLGKHHSDDDDLKGDSWLTIQMLISDIWHSFKFEGFGDKLIKLFKPLEYSISTELKQQILTHVIIRNCIQHHDWQLEASSLKSLGRESIGILQEDNTTLTIFKWKKIILSKNEIINFIDHLICFADDFSNHVSGRVVTRHHFYK
jgi:hypothetical protein